MDFENEEYDKCCGEIFLTTKGNLIFHCVLCTEVTKDYDSYRNHVKNEHLWTNEIYFNDGFPESDYENESEEISETQEYIGMEFIENQQKEADSSGNESLEIIDQDNIIEKLLEYNEKQEKHKEAKEQSDHLENTMLSDCTENYNRIKTHRNIKRFSSNVKLKARTITAKPTNIMKFDTDLFHELPTCDRPQLKQLGNLRSDLKDKERKFQCPYCNFAAFDKTNLWSHIRRHSNNKPYKCEYCPKDFHTKYELIFHTRYHTGERPHLCADCGRAFVTKQQLNDHVKRHRNQRDYQCSECEKAFFSKQELRGHMTVHTKETPFKCSDCGSVFTRKKALYAHKKLHENKKTYKCNICGTGYNQGAGLYLHMKTKHKVLKNFQNI